MCIACNVYAQEKKRAAYLLNVEQIQIPMDTILRNISIHLM